MAKAILARADALVANGDRVSALRTTDDGALQRLLADALANGKSGTLVLPRRSGGRDYFAFVRAIASPTGCAVLTITDPEHVVEPTQGWLRRLFGLTAAESRLALRLFAGRTLTEAAIEIGISTATSRVHLAHIFRKTRTTRQAELIRLLMSYPWDELALNDPDSG